MHRKVAGLLAVALVLGGVGCGGDDPLTRAELVRAADAICKRMGRQTSAALEAAGKQARGREIQEVPDVAADLLAKFKRYRDEAADELEGLEAPEDLASRYDQYIAGVRESTTLLPTVASLESGKDPNLRAREALERRNQRLARGIGLKSCS